MEGGFPREHVVPLEAVIRGWLSVQAGYDRREPAWVALRRELKRMGHWKDRPRGDPKKGRAVQKGVVGW